MIQSRPDENGERLGDAFGQLLESVRPELVRFAYWLARDRSIAEDVVQESFVYAFKNLHRFDPSRAAFKTWLYTIAVSRSRNIHRRQRFAQVDLSQLFQHKVASASSDEPEARFSHQAAQDTVAHALASLAQPLREAVILRYGHSLTYREIADVMNCPPKTAESRVRLAHQKLHRLLEPVGHRLLEELLSF